jgi:hypothetical protein
MTKRLCDIGAFTLMNKKEVLLMDLIGERISEEATICNRNASETPLLNLKIKKVMI